MGPKTPIAHTGLPQGTLDLLILKTLSLESRHGWAISERLTQISGATLTIRQGSLYPALHRMERRGWLESEWGFSDNNRQVKYYRLTRRGREYLQRESSGWKEFATAVFKVLQTT